MSGLLTEFLSGTYRIRRLLGASPETLKQHGVTLNHFRRFLCREPTLADLESNQIAAFLIWFLPNRSRSTAWGARKHLLAWARFAHQKGLIAEVPDVAPVRPLRRAPTVYDTKDIARLLAAARDRPGAIQGVPCGWFYPALFLVYYDTGCRASAAWSLRWTDWTPPTLLFRAEVAKDREDQLLRVSAQTAEAIEAIRLPERDLIFPWPFCRRVKYYRIKAIFRAAGLPCGRRDLMQRIRRTNATLFHRAGGDASRQLGHSDPTLARKHYLDPTGESQAADVLPRPVVSPQLRIYG